MIDIRITNDGTKAKIMDESAIDIMTALDTAVFVICRENNLPIRAIVNALIVADETFNNKEA